MNSEKNEIQRRDYSFLKKVWYSITKFENYPEMAAFGISRALIYLSKLLIIFSVALTFIICICINRYSQMEGINEDTTFFEKIEKTLNINFNESQQEQISEVISKYDYRTLNIAFIIASGIYDGV